MDILEVAQRLMPGVDYRPYGNVPIGTSLVQIENGIRYLPAKAIPPDGFDIIRINAENYFSLPGQIQDVAETIKTTGKAILDVIDYQAYCWDQLQFAGKMSLVQDAHCFLSDVQTPESLEAKLRENGFVGPVFENRLAFPNFRLTAYKAPICWEVLETPCSYEDIIGKNCIVTTEPNRDWDTILNDYKCDIEPIPNVTSLLMSTFARPDATDVVQVTSTRALWQDYDEYIFLCDRVPEDMFTAMTTIFNYMKDKRHITLIFSADVTGIVHAWNRMFAAARGEFIFINSSDFMTHDPFKEPILLHFADNERLGWVMGQPAGRLGKGFAYASGFRAKALREVGFLSSEFSPCTCDDNDLAAKLLLASWDICACRHTEVSHLAPHGGGTCDWAHGITQDKTYMHWRQPAKMHVKYREHPEVLKRCMDLWGGTPYCDEL